MTAVRLGVDLQQVRELLAPLIPAAHLNAVQQGAQLRQLLRRQVRGEPLKEKGLRLHLGVAQDRALLCDEQLLPAAVLRMGAALDIALFFQLGGPAGNGALIQTVLFPQLLLGDAGTAVDGVDHVIVGKAQVRVAQCLGHEALGILIDFSYPASGGVHGHASLLFRYSFFLYHSR